MEILDNIENLPCKVIAEIYWERMCAAQLEKDWALADRMAGEYVFWDLQSRHQPEGEA